MNDEQQRLQRLENQISALASVVSALLTVFLALAQSVVPEHPQLPWLYGLREQLKSIKPRKR